MRAMRTALIIFRASWLCLLFSSPALAQTTTSTIEGTVKDPHGAVVAGAQIKTSSPSLATERTTTSDENGVYRITALPAGTYLHNAPSSRLANTPLRRVELTVKCTPNFDVQL